MTTYFTKEPLGSTSPYVLFDNAQNFDYALNDITQAIWKDRFGRDRKTYWGMEQEFSAQLLSQQLRFNTFIQSSGYKVIGEYTAGPLTITEYNQLIRYQDEFWKLTAATSIPFTTTGNDAASWANDSANFVSVGDAVIRQELASSGGAGLVGGVAKPVTWTGFAGGADPTGATLSDAAFAAAEQSDEEVYLPSGTYKLTSNYHGRFTFADGVIFSGAGVAYKKDTGLQTDSSPGVSIDRFNRVFVGDAAYSSDGSSDGATSWLGGKSDVAPNGSLQPGLTWPERVAQFASITSRGGAAVMAGSHTKNLTAGSAQSLVGIAVNDNETLLASSRAMYLDAKRYANSVGPAYAAELQITNLGTFVDEYAVGSKKTFGLSIFAGGDPVINGNTDDATLALAIANNGAKFGTGITFAPLALRIIQEAGLNDYGRAMTLRGGQRIGWEDSAGKTRAYINSVVTDDTRKVGVFFQNGVVDIKGPSSVGFRVSGDVGDTAYLRARSGNATSQLVRL
ncbi:hypothetical protein FHC09_22355, partial [Enterobacter roggenkampii]|nr:hypothetical protein [Enterobacter roggenkampii]